MNKSFTLIEILVVIVVIGILSSFILVGMSSINDKANIAKVQAFINSLDNSLLLARISQWKFNEVAGSTIAVDSWGTNTGTLSGGATVPQFQTTGCVSGNCLLFDGTDDYVDVLDSTNLNPTNEITVSAWIKRTGKLSDTDIIISKDNVGTKRQYSLYIDPNNNFYFIIFKSGISYKSIPSFSAYISLNIWYHVVGTYKYVTDGTSIMDLYVNGSKNAIQVTNAAGPIVVTDEHLRIGDDGYVPTNRTFQGLIDDARIYNQAISTSEIQQNYFVGINKLFKNNGISSNEFNQRIVELKNNIANNE